MSTNGTIQSAGGPLERLATLRVLVAYLGEKDQFDWWPTAFLTVTGQRFLELNFPRTLLSAGVTCVCQAAKDLHDQRIGHAGAFHLFRLPHGLEQDVHRFLATDDGRDLVGLISGREQAVAGLNALAEEEGACSEGPVRVAALGQCTHRPSLRRVAACYRDAFERGHRTFPYFTPA